MTYSLNEIEAMGKRAARGAGRDWGIAEEAGKAARWLAARGLPGPRLLAETLEQHDRQPHDGLAPASTAGTWRAAGGRLCPLAAGAALSDIAGELAAGRELGPVTAPLLLVPYAAMAAKACGAPVRLSWQGGMATVFPDGRLMAEGEGIGASAAEAVTCGLAPDALAPESALASIPAVDPAVWARLDALAQRTFAPATEASRLLGAGAGVTDND